MDIFKNIFIDRFFPREIKEAKVVEIINLLQGGMGVHKYSLKFSKLSKYSPSFVSDFRYEITPFVMGVSDDFQEECHSAMLHNNMRFSSYGAWKLCVGGKV